MASFKAYELKSVLLTTQRLGFDETSYELKNSVAELNIFESIELPYLTANLLFVDDSGFRSAVKINGTERVTIEVVVPDSGQPPLMKKFMVTGVNKEVKVGDRTDAMLLTMIEEHAYLSAINRISETHEGPLRDIINNVLVTHVNKELEIDPDFVDPANGPLRFLSPWITPLEVVETIRDRMVSEQGAPYFCYATLRDDKIKLTEMKSQIEIPSWNIGNEYVYGQNAHNVVLHPDNDNTENLVRSLFYIVEHYKAQSNDSTLQMAQSGALGLKAEFIDMFTGEPHNFQHNGFDTLEELMSEELDDGSIVAPDDSLTFSNRVLPETKVSDFPSVVISQLVTSQTFAGLNGLHDESGDADMYLLKIKAASIRMLIMNSTYQVSVPGTPYLLNPDAGVGTNIDINFVKPIYGDSGVDLEKSGKFMIYNVRHMFRDERHTAHMDVVKLTKKVNS